jgi:hypothetical protein
MSNRNGRRTRFVVYAVLGGSLLNKGFNTNDYAYMSLSLVLILCCIWEALAED